MAGPVIRVPGGGTKGRRPGMVFAVVFLFPMALWLTYNWFDTPIEPAAQAVLDAKPETVPPEENLFLALLAFPIGGDEPAHVRGAAALEALAKAPAPKEGQPQPTYAQALDRPTAQFDEGQATMCSPGNRPGAYECVRNSQAQRAVFDQLVPRIHPLLLRYRELERYPRYSDPRPGSIDQPMPDATAYRVGLVNLSVIALAIGEGSIEQGAAVLARSAAIWRRVLAARDATLVDKIVASRAYAAHLMFVSELVREWPQAREGAAAAELETLLRPLADSERSLAGALAGEFRIQARTWEQIADPSQPVVRKDFPASQSWWYRLMTKKNDTINRSYRELDRLAVTEREGCVAVRKAFDEINARPKDTGMGLRWYEWFYNPIGRILQRSSHPDTLIDYLGRQCNLVALQGMVSLQLELARRGESPENAASAVESLASKFKDPNTGTAYGYDAKTRTLSFHYVGRDGQYVTPLPLQRVP
ncbi:MAG: hypothetical protein K0Q76_2811 [Panacagrimonas sp.]|jgi:hypothetical protein|nr:hypothetical protein [Panacagrimonas sp.]MCC2657703.1 hypothetical protein [Panacagrimonas sp.]